MRKLYEQQQSEKVALYRALDEKFKQGANDTDEDSTLELLKMNPDYNTAWNRRRSRLLAKSPDGIIPDGVLAQEVDLTSALMKSYPKSYWLFNHRRWALESMQAPSYEKELVLCQKMLMMDHRNFHAWDYRRWLMSRLYHGELSPAVVEMELKFTLEKISQNFSNYSAWHYRSKLITLVENQSTDTLSHTKLQRDVDIVHSAIFTEPNDSSAWLYYEWLLTRNQSSFLKYYYLKGEYLHLFFWHSVKVASHMNKFFINGTQTSCAWINPNNLCIDAKSGCFSDHWIIYLRQPGIESMEMPCKFFQSNSGAFNHSFKIDFSQSADDILAQEEKRMLAHVSVVEELLEEEPDSKNAIKFLVEAYINLRRFSEAQNLIRDKLVVLDPCRKGFYRDQIQTLQFLENVVTAAQTGTGAVSFNECALSDITLPFIPEMLDITQLTMRGCSLTSACFLDRFINMRRLDLAGNQLAAIPSSLCLCVDLYQLVLDNNHISDNELSTLNYLEDLPSLESPYLNGNPCSSTLKARSSSEIAYMMHALRLSWKSDRTGTAYCVGAVLVDARSGEIVSTGYSRELEGNTHAEQCAIMKLRDPIRNDKSLVLYTTMIPCSVRLSGNKSCVDWIIETGVISTVVYAIEEPKHFVDNRNSASMLSSGGITVEHMAEFSKEINVVNSHL